MSRFGFKRITNQAQARERSRILSHVTASILVFFFTIVLFQFNLDGLRGLLFDATYRTQWWSEPNHDVVLISYDEASSRRYEGAARFPVAELEKLLDYINLADPKAVAVIASINDKLYSHSELEKLRDLFGRSPKTLVGYIDDESLGRPPPLALRDVVKYYPAFVSRDTFSYGADSVSRRVMISIDGYDSAYAELVRVAKKLPVVPSFQNAQTYGRSENSSQTFINWQGPAGTYHSIPSYLVSEGKMPLDTFRDKVVLVGDSLTLPKTSQFILTPYGREPFETSVIEGAAHSFVTLYENKGIKRSPYFLDLIVCLLLGLLTVNLVLSMSPGKGILLIFVELILLFIVSWSCLFGFQIWFGTAHPLIIACVSYYLVIPYRLLNEYRERWHYQEKSELMIQLEQLKTNFLSLVSHDLKTPIARIQGNAELLLNGVEDDKQRKSISAIVKTTEELSDYVQTILDLTRIETAQFPIQKTSKDINAIVKDVIESKRFLAVEKGITLRTELEPIFSFKFDVKLITRVIANLVENAIKYSPPNTEITLRSKEENGWIRLAIADQGVGIPTEEQEKVFGKFYRGKNVETENVKGTGLGLYLVKYFVELHRGMVELKSEMGKGSTFTVSLPV